MRKKSGGEGEHEKKNGKRTAEQRIRPCETSVVPTPRHCSSAAVPQWPSVPQREDEDLFYRALSVEIRRDLERAVDHVGRHSELYLSTVRPSSCDAT